MLSNISRMLCYKVATSERTYLCNKQVNTKKWNYDSSKCGVAKTYGHAVNQLHKESTFMYVSS